MKLIVGLGNPGKKYENTRHNIGFKAIDFLLKYFDIYLTNQKYNGFFVKRGNVIFAKPNTYMNLSGNFISSISSYFNIENKDILVIYDDMSFDFGQGKMKTKGSSGGHNGIKDIISQFGTENILRMKIGIGKKEKRKNHVLGIITPEEMIKFKSMKNKIIHSVNLFIKDDKNKSVEDFNK
ncbi:MAG: aminoacyl-tRNA hydrolase [Mollicutes bacterium PWAP]|nr:aminoacyl-tRNA hydrolase [Mollicutes bacterium PWAP]